MNTLAHTGYLIEDAKYFPAQNGNRSRATFAMAVRRPFSKASDIYDYIAWNATADIVGNGLAEGRYLKGCSTEISGYTAYDSYTDSESGKKRNRLQIVVQQCYSRLLDEREDYYIENNGGESYEEAYQAAPPYYQETPQPSQYGNRVPAGVRQGGNAGRPTYNGNPSYGNVPQPSQRNGYGANPTRTNAQASPHPMNGPVQRVNAGNRPPMRRAAQVPGANGVANGQGGFIPAAKRGV